MRRSRSIRLVVLLAASLAGLAPALAREPLGPEQKQAAKALRSACSADWRRLCNAVEPGGGRILACFQAHAAELSAPCRTALDAARELRRSSPAPTNM